MMRMSKSPHVEDLIPFYALGGLEASEAERVAAHLETCPACRHLADEALAIVALLPYAAPPVTPSPETRSRLMARIQRRRTGDEKRTTFALRLPSPVVNAWRALAPTLAGLGLALAVILAGLNISLLTQINQLRQQNQNLSERLQQQQQYLALITAQQTQARELKGTDLAPGGAGRIYFDPAQGSGLLVVYGLEALSPNETYQFWMIGANGPESAGLFRVQANGQGELLINWHQAFQNYQAVGVSREPAGGSPQPSRIVLLGQL